MWACLHCFSSFVRPRAVRLSDKSVQRGGGKKKWHTRRDFSTPAVVVAGKQRLPALCFTPVAPTQDDTSYRGVCVCGWLQDMKRTWRATGSSSRVRRARPHMSVTHCRCQDHRRHLLGKKEVRRLENVGFVRWTWRLWSRQVGSLWGRPCVCAWVNVQERDMVSEHSTAVYPHLTPSHQSNCVGLNCIPSVWGTELRGNNELKLNIKWDFST